MKRFHHHTAIAITAILSVSLAGCNFLSRVANIGEAPKLSDIQDPTERVGYKPISMPMPTPSEPMQISNSLWRPGSKTFFKDQRASQVGDLLTVLVNINDSAEVKNSSTTSRTGANAAGISGLAGLDKQIPEILPGADPTALLGTNSSSSTNGTGQIQRNEKVAITVSAVVTQILPNGNYVIHGRQETRVNYEVRELQVAGVVRPQDITSSNTITLSQIAEARVSYGGKGSISDLQQPRYGQQLVDIILPF